jgi:hypothetical protein
MEGRRRGRDVQKGTRGKGAPDTCAAKSPNLVEITILAVL